MSAYRHPHLRRWRVLYHLPWLDRVGRHAVLLGSAAVTALGLLTTLVGPIFGGIAGLALAGFGLMVAFTSGTLLGITWLTRLPEIAERTISEISADERDPSRCRVLTGGERWTLPIAATDLAIGQRIRVSYREIAPRDDTEPGRELLEVRVLDD